MTPHLISPPPHSQLEHQYLRIINLELMLKYGDKVSGWWLIVGWWLLVVADDDPWFLRFMQPSPLSLCYPQQLIPGLI